MNKKIIASLLVTLLSIGVSPIGVSAEWKQNLDNSWSWSENGSNIYYGWKQINRKWYHFNSQKMQTGWLKDGSWYYLSSDGDMEVGWINDGKNEYYMNSSGAMLINAVVDGYYLDSKGVKQIKENQKIIIKKGEIFTVILDENASTGYSWNCEVDGKNSQLVNERVIQTDINLSGAPSKKVWEFKANNTGTYKILFSYVRPWEKDVAAIKTVEYVIEVN